MAKLAVQKLRWLVLRTDDTSPCRSGIRASFNQSHRQARPELSRQFVEQGLREAHGAAVRGKRSRRSRPSSPYTTSKENRFVPRPATLCRRVTRLQPMRLPAQAARQLPDQSTTLRVESSSTDNPRLRGALPRSDISHAGRRRAPPRARAPPNLIPQI